MSIEKEITDWLHDRPEWQQEAVARLLAHPVGDSDLNELTALCKTPGGQEKTKTRVFPGLESHDIENKAVSIVSIGDVEGIGNLRPRRPVPFGEGNLVVVYGNNGSGKSGYVRILKKACGKANAEDLRPDVFAEAPAKRSCRIQYKVDESRHTTEWQVDGTTLAELAATDIFDAEGGRLYLRKESEVSYTPRSLAIFDDLVQVCKQVKERLQKEKAALPSKLPAIPLEYRDTQAAKLFLGLRATHTEAQLASILLWTKDDKKMLDELEERLKTDDPSKLASANRGQKDQIEGILNKIASALLVFSPESCGKLIELRDHAQNKRQIASEAATKVLKSDCLDGVGSDTWRALWEAARRYSDERAYPTVSFPHVADGAKCVLCQQLLLTEAKQRLTEFEKYVKGELEASARAAEREYADMVKALPRIQDEENLKTVCQAAGLSIEDWMPRLSSIWKAVAAAEEKIVNPLVREGATINRDAYPWIEELRTLATDLEARAQQYDADTQSFDRERAMKDRTELQAKQWTAQQAESIKGELSRLRTVAQYDQWIVGTDHTAISRKAGDIAEKVITKAYIRRFNDELKKLGAKGLRVELVKTRIASGKAMHGIRLRGVIPNDVSPLDILSEGEKRVVELAAFLADVMGRSNKAPFVFDDPISSLDQDYEEKTIDRLIELSVDRQVVVFTHRLSFLGILCDKANPDTVCIRQEPWGTGEPGDVPLFGKRPENALKKLRDERLVQAGKTLQEHGWETYYPLAKSICSDFRILVERIVELVLLADVVQRHRRELHTKGKIENLCKTRRSDCEIIDDFMTKYSCYEHSQSSEAPVEVPEPEAIRTDIDRLLDWHSEYKNRQLDAA